MPQNYTDTPAPVAPATPAPLPPEQNNAAYQVALHMQPAEWAASEAANAPLAE